MKGWVTKSITVKIMAFLLIVYSQERVNRENQERLSKRLASLTGIDQSCMTATELKDITSVLSKLMKVFPVPGDVNIKVGMTKLTSYVYRVS